MLRNAISRARNVRRDEGGFTLIELLIVIIILGVLAAIVVFSVRGITNNSEQAACRTEHRLVGTAIEAYYAETGSYPADDDFAALAGGGFLQDADTQYVTGFAPGADGSIDLAPGLTTC